MVVQRSKIVKIKKEVFFGMGSLVQQIENHIKKLLTQNQGLLRIQRNQLAELFSCVPSQVNYVLKTRFTIERGYLVESQRGGGGFIEIKKLIFEHPEKDFFYSVIEIIGNQISQRRAFHLLHNLHDRGILTHREAKIIEALLHRRNLSIDLPYRDYLRAKLLKAALGSVMTVSGADD